MTALAVDPLSGAAAASALLPAGAGMWSMPFVVENAGYWTGPAILNPTDTAVTMEFASYNPTGILFATVLLTLEPRRGRIRLVSQWIPSLPGESTGRIEISAPGNVSPLAYFGTDDGASLAAIPFPPLSPAPPAGP